MKNWEGMKIVEQFLGRELKMLDAFREGGMKTSRSDLVFPFLL